MNVYSIPLGNNMCSMGALFGGTQGTSMLMQSLSENDPKLAFYNNENSPLNARYKDFMGIVSKLNESERIISNVTNKMVNSDYIRPIVSMADLEAGIPPSMHLPIVYYQPVRVMLEDGLVDGFGIDPKSLAPNDIYESVLQSGYVDNITSESLDEDDCVELVYKYNTDDPELTDDEVDAIRETREYIDKFMTDKATSHLDFTDYTSLHG